ncbi:MAG: tRNA pseudouridine(55) synthase TruB [Clostridiales bacterium]|jgi:tRNA pseudouridine55 synthase|nr:tRNA pseudouridine(55) synthase TruB [Clostridiales bacterium]
MNGIICINKPEGFTSFDVIAKLRGILKMKRIGHSGTLDPMATGVLPVFLGNATKACDMLSDNDKSYLADFKLGCTTDTQDSTGEVLSTSEIAVSHDEFIKVMCDFIGEIEQIPPMFSAVSVNGKRLYELARKGIEIERKSRKIQIDKLELREYDNANRTGRLFIECSKGTYVRTIIHDIGQKLGCGGIMTGLVRLSSNGFTLDGALTLDEVKSLSDENRLEEFILPIEKVFEHLPKLYLDKNQTRLYKNGVRLDLTRLNGVDKADRYAVYGYDRQFIGTALAVFDKNELKVEKNFFI